MNALENEKYLTPPDGHVHLAVFDPTAVKQRVRPMCANENTGRRSLARGAGPRDERRYGAFELETEGTVIYDAENDAAWIQSTVATPLSVRR